MMATDRIGNRHLKFAKSCLEINKQRFMGVEEKAGANNFGRQDRKGSKVTVGEKASLMSN